MIEILTVSSEAYIGFKVSGNVTVEDFEPDQIEEA